MDETNTKQGKSEQFLTTLKVETGIPVPPKRDVGVTIKSFWESLNYGDSFELTCRKKLDSMRTNINSPEFTYRQFHTARGPAWRVWKIRREPDQPTEMPI